ncbi:MAG: sulfur carrier protein ThiS adenylyltransferase ThiF [Kiritimatiellae bacterium]|nr:sulfur carrier protein ThiS adenylyltransferase ThiF [Kiritimatiellia bacterium]
MDDFLQRLTARNDPGLTETLQSAAVGIAGCGGLGSNIAVALTRIGIGKLVLADFDAVDASNLNRQYYFIEDIGRPKVEALEATLRRINPRIRTEKRAVRLDEINVFELFKDCRVVAEAFHAAADKTMLVTAFSDPRFRDRYLVCASGMASIHSSNLIQTCRIARNVFACGDFQNEPDKTHGLMAPRVAIAAGHQANMIVRILAGELDP